MENFSLKMLNVEANAINVVQGAWVVERERVLRTILGSCVSVCLFDPVAGVGGMNHYVFPPRNSKSLTQFTATTLSADICMEGLLDALLALGAKKDRLRAKAFGGGAMFGRQEDVLAVGKRNSSYARFWLDRENIPLDLGDFHGQCARKLLFYPKTGEHLCRRLPPAVAPANLRLLQGE